MTETDPLHPPDVRLLFEQWFTSQVDDDDRPPIPASTVIVLRDNTDQPGPDVLMMRKNSAITFGGTWVFPGGRLDPEDYGDRPDDDFGASAAAAVREAHEEGDLVLDPAKLVRYSHWMPPRQAPKRYSTWFFIAEAPSGDAGDVTIDDGEITDHDWVSAAMMLERHAAGEVELTPPTWVTLHELADHENVARALAATAAATPRFYVTRLARADHGPVAMWTGDAAYDCRDLTIDGGRHRLTMHAAGGWRFERSADI